MSGWSLAPGEPGYPEQLADLEKIDTGERASCDAGGGPVLHGAGALAAVAGLSPEAATTVVGARRASGYGLAAAEQLGADLARAGVTVVSGMAIGIDAAAHRGALAAGGRTVAVLAGGADVAYPSRHRGLYRRLVARGAAISDRPWGWRPHRHDFPARNRIMAALSRVVVVVEAAEPSGSLVTARRARELGRELGAFPGQAGIGVAAGTNGLIKDGAHMIRDAADVLDLLAGVGVERIHRTGAPLDPAHESLLDAVERGAHTPDQLAERTRIEPVEIAAALTRLELLGYVAGDGLGGYRRSALARPAASPWEPGAGSRPE